MIRIRPDRESSAIQDAAPKSVLDVYPRTAATLADLGLVFRERPDVLHLCFHCGDEKLSFSDRNGDPEEIPVDTVVRLLQEFLKLAKFELGAIVLSVCDSAEFADQFIPLAGTVIAWKDDLDDECAVEFSREFYRAAVRNPPPPLGAAARTAARDVDRCGPCENLSRQLVVLPEGNRSAAEVGPVARLVPAPRSRPPVEAGWALFGKHPGSFDDYGVIAASSGPFSPNEFKAIIGGYSPGEPSPGRKANIDALPWVSFSNATLRDTTYIGIAVQDWSDHADGMNRPIAFTRYFCIRFDDIGDASTFTDLYHAVRDIELPWEVPAPLAGGPLSLQLPAADPAALAHAVQSVSVGRAAAAAAALFEGPVAVLGETTDLLGRLRFLDAVAALLPAGARAWLSASSWADSRTHHRLSLAFTQRARSGVRCVTEQGDDEGPPDEPGQVYRGELVRLSRVRGTVAVVAHLATLITHRTRRVDEAAEALADLDLAEVVLAAARGNALEPRSVRRLGAVGRFGDLSPADREFVLGCYLQVAQADDLRADLQLLAEQWSPALNATLTQVARQRLWRDDWPVAGLARLAAVADRVDVLEAFMAVLMPPGDRARSSAALGVAADFVAHLDTEFPYSERLLPTVVQVPTLTVAILRRCLISKPGEAANWLHRLDQPARQTLESRRWASIAMPFKVVLRDGTDAVDSTEIAALSLLDPFAVPDLVSACQAGRPDRLELLLPGVLPWLGRQLTRLDSFQQQRWGRELAELTAVEAGRQAEIDLLLYRLGRVPVRGLDQAGHDGSVRQPRYLDSFVRHTRQADLSDEEHDTLMDALAGGVQPGWSAPQSRFEAVLGLLWEVSHSPDGTPSCATISLLKVITSEIETRTELWDHPAFARWRSELGDYPELECKISFARLRDKPVSASADAAADSIMRLLTSGYAEPDVIAILTEYLAPQDQTLIQYLLAISAGLMRAGHSEPLDFTDRLYRRIIKSGVDDPPAAVPTPTVSDALVVQLNLVAMLFETGIQEGGIVVRVELLQQWEEAYRRIGDSLARLGVQRDNERPEGKRRIGSLMRLVGGRPDPQPPEPRTNEVQS